MINWVLLYPSRTQSSVLHTSPFSVSLPPVHTTSNRTPTRSSTSIINLSSTQVRFGSPFLVVPLPLCPVKNPRDSPSWSNDRRSRSRGSMGQGTFDRSGVGHERPTPTYCLGGGKGEASKLTFTLTFLLRCLHYEPNLTTDIPPVYDYTHITIRDTGT